MWKVFNPLMDSPIRHENLRQNRSISTLRKEKNLSPSRIDRNQSPSRIDGNKSPTRNDCTGSPLRERIDNQPSPIKREIHRYNIRKKSSKRVSKWYFCLMISSIIFISFASTYISSTVDFVEETFISHSNHYEGRKLIVDGQKSLEIQVIYSQKDVMNYQNDIAQRVVPK